MYLVYCFCARYSKNYAILHCSNRPRYPSFMFSLQFKFDCCLTLQSECNKFSFPHEVIVPFIKTRVVRITSGPCCVCIYKTKLRSIIIKHLMSLQYQQCIVICLLQSSHEGMTPKTRWLLQSMYSIYMAIFITGKLRQHLKALIQKAVYIFCPSLY